MSELLPQSLLLLVMREGSKEEEEGILLTMREGSDSVGGDEEELEGEELEEECWPSEESVESASVSESEESKPSSPMMTILWRCFWLLRCLWMS